MQENMKYTIAEWNIDRKTADYEGKKKEIENLVNQNDIVFLTEISSKANEQYYSWLKQLERERRYFTKSYKVNDKEYIYAIVSKEKFESFVFNDLAEINKARISTMGLNLKTSLEKEEIKIRGVRFHTEIRAENKKEFKYQIYSIIKDIVDNSTDIIIGDYNWNTVFSYYLPRVLGFINEKPRVNKEEYKKKSEEIFNKIKSLYKKDISSLLEQCDEERLCNLCNVDCKHDYEIWPKDSEKDYGFSFEGKIKRGKNAGTVYHTSPDRVMWNRSRVKKENVEYFPKLDTNKNLDEAWPSDHRVIRFEFSVNKM